MSLDFTPGQKLRFSAYGSSIMEGEFVRMEGDVIIVKTTKDFLFDMIGKEQGAHKQFLVTDK